MLTGKAQQAELERIIARQTLSLELLPRFLEFCILNKFKERDCDPRKLNDFSIK